MSNETPAITIAGAPQFYGSSFTVYVSLSIANKWSIGLKQSVRKDHYVDHLAAVGQNNRVLATQDIKNEQGALLIAKGTPITAETARRIAHHKLMDPLETSTAMESSLSPAHILAQLEKMPKHPELVRLQALNPVVDKHFRRQCERLADYPPILQKITVFAQRLPLFFDKTLISAHIALLIAAELELSETAIGHIFLASMTRDLGLLHIDPDIVQSTHELTPQQWRLLRGHVAIGHYFLSILPNLPKPVSRAVLEHHERTDGLGYPYGKLGDELCVEGQVIALADTIIALFNKQVDVQGYSPHTLIPILQLNISVHFNHLTETAICLLRKLASTSERVYTDGEIPAVIANIVDRQPPLAAWFEQIRALIEEVSAHSDNRYVRSTNALLARIQATLISSGLVASEQRLWLEDVLKNRRIEDYFDVECTELMLDEIGWQFRQLNNTLALAIDNLLLPEDARERLHNQFSPLNRALGYLLSVAKNAA